MVEFALLAVFPALLAFAAASDLLTMTIPNRVSIALVGSFLALGPLLGLPLAEIGLHLLAGLAVLAVCFGMFAAGWMGGGDAKLAAGTAVWLGFAPLMDYLVVTALFGGLLTLALIKLRDVPMPAFVEHWAWSRRLHAATSGVPYGIALSAAGLVVYPDSPLWRLAIAG